MHFNCEREIITIRPFDLLRYPRLIGGNKRVINGKDARARLESLVSVSRKLGTLKAPRRQLSAYGGLIPEVTFSIVDYLWAWKLQNCYWLTGYLDHNRKKPPDGKTEERNVSIEFYSLSSHQSLEVRLTSRDLRFPASLPSKLTSRAHPICKTFSYRTFAL